MVQSAGCFSRGPGSIPSTPIAHKPSGTLVPGDPAPSFDLPGLQALMWCTDICAGKTPMQNKTAGGHIYPGPRRLETLILSQRNHQKMRERPGADPSLGRHTAWLSLCLWPLTFRPERQTSAEQHCRASVLAYDQSV